MGQKNSTRIVEHVMALEHNRWHPNEKINKKWARPVHPDLSIPSSNPHQKPIVLIPFSSSSQVTLPSGRILGMTICLVV